MMCYGTPITMITCLWLDDTSLDEFNFSNYGFPQPYMHNYMPVVHVLCVTVCFVGLACHNLWITDFQIASYSFPLIARCDQMA